MFKLAMVLCGLITSSAFSATYSCRTDAMSGEKILLHKEFLIDTAKKESQSAFFDFFHEEKTFRVDCGVVEHRDATKSLVCGLNKLDKKTKSWMTTARGVTEVGASVLAVLANDEEMTFDVNCQANGIKN